jgi:hypothetical protein
MSKEELAQQLDRSEYPFRVSKELAAAAKAAGLLIVYGASDDLMEFDGVFRDDVGAWDGTTAKIDAEGVFPNWYDFCHTEEGEAAYEKYFLRKPKAREITARWADEGYSFTFDIPGVPYATFDVVEEGDNYCRGIVFSVADL